MREKPHPSIYNVHHDSLDEIMMLESGIHIINYIIKSTRGYKQFAFWGDGHDIRKVGMTHTKVAAATATMAIDKALCWFGFSLRYICEMMKFPWIIMAWNGFCQALTAEFRTVLTAFRILFSNKRITSLPIIGKPQPGVSSYVFILLTHSIVHRGHNNQLPQSSARLRKLGRLPYLDPVSETTKPTLAPSRTSTGNFVPVGFNSYTEETAIVAAIDFAFYERKVNCLMFLLFTILHLRRNENESLSLVCTPMRCPSSCGSPRIIASGKIQQILIVHLQRLGRFRLVFLAREWESQLFLGELLKRS
ncbi:hypothetical protein C8Q75DRAFT_733848 [Abortiporus biennis]|nr:hypothetical protein C8Q75DRAFT_733848 [Abortiporus biennis]